MSGLRWTVGARLIAQLSTWAITVLVIRILAPGDYGLLSMATVFIAFLWMFSEFGLGSAIIQIADVKPGTLAQVFGIVLVIHCSLALLLALSAPLIATFFDEARLAPVVRVLSVQFLIAAFAVIPDALLQRRLHFKGRALFDLAASIIGSVTTLGLALAGKGVWSLVVSALLAQVIRTIGINILAPYLHWPQFSLRGMRSLIVFGGHLTLARILSMFVSQIDALICGKLLGRDVLGFYSVAMHLASLPNQRISGIINQVAFPAFSRMQHDIPKVGAYFLRGSQLLSLFSFSVLWGISSVAPEIVEGILGPKWAPAMLPLQVLGLVMPLRMVGNFLPNPTQAIGRTDIVLWNTMWSAVITPIALFVGAKEWGLQGLAIAWLAATPPVFLQSVARSLPAMGLKPMQLVKAMMPAALAGVVMYASVALTRTLLPSGYNILVRLSVLILAGAAAYIAASLVGNRSGLAEARALLRDFVRNDLRKST